jgi:hypothetical protein
MAQILNTDIMNRFTKDVYGANHLYRVANWYGCLGLSFHSHDIENIELFAQALQGVKGVEDIEICEPNEYGITFVHWTPKTNIAYAISNSIVEMFRTY